MDYSEDEDESGEDQRVTAEDEVAVIDETEVCDDVDCDDVDDVIELADEVASEEDDAEETVPDDSETIGGLIREAIEAKATEAVEDAIEGREPVRKIELRLAEPDKSAETDDDELVAEEQLEEEVAAARAPQLPPPGEIARLGVRRSTLAPKRIGSGRLVPARLTWKPGDPFATPSRPKRAPFRWELMLTSACITAVCGLGCVWLLRNLLT